MRQISLFLLLVLASVSVQAQSINDCAEYVEAREKGKFAYTERHNADLIRILVDNDPEHLDLYGACVEALSVVGSIEGLLNPSIYVNVASMKAIVELIKNLAVKTVCREALFRARETYAEISDVIPYGTYSYEIEGIIDVLRR